MRKFLVATLSVLGVLIVACAGSPSETAQPASVCGSARDQDVCLTAAAIVPPSPTTTEFTVTIGAPCNGGYGMGAVDFSRIEHTSGAMVWCGWGTWEVFTDPQIVANLKVFPVSCAITDGTVAEMVAGYRAPVRCERASGLPNCGTPIASTLSGLCQGNMLIAGCENDVIVVADNCNEGGRLCVPGQTPADPTGVGECRAP